MLKKTWEGGGGVIVSDAEINENCRVITLKVPGINARADAKDKHFRSL